MVHTVTRRMDHQMDNTILIVEDDPEIQEVLTLNLQNAGYRVLRASSIRQMFVSWKRSV